MCDAKPSHSTTNMSLSSTSEQNSRIFTGIKSARHPAPCDSPSLVSRQTWQRGTERPYADGDCLPAPAPRPAHAAPHPLLCPRRLTGHPLPGLWVLVGLSQWKEPETDRERGRREGLASFLPSPWGHRGHGRPPSTQGHSSGQHPGLPDCPLLAAGQ